MQACVIHAHDGFELAATRHAPAGEVKAVVLMPGAMGVKQDYYAPFASFLAEHGFAVLTFDYRGMGRSRRGQYERTLRGLKADLHTWAEQDYNAALRAAREWYSDVPLYIVGHSLGGQLPGLLPDNHLIDGILTVAAGSGYWPINAKPTKRIVPFLWYFMVPVMTPIFGYFPGKRLGMVGDLPKGVIYQWSRWCRSPHYVCDEQGQPIRAGYDRLRVPLLALSFTDDEMMSRASIDRLHECYRHALQERRYITPRDVGAKRIGHFGFFREQFRDSLWQQARDWLDGQAGAQRQRAA